MWAALLAGAFAVIVYAATDTVLRFVSDQSESGRGAGRSGSGISVGIAGDPEANVPRR